MTVLPWNFHRRQWKLLLTSIDAILLPWKLPSTSMGVIYLHGMDVGGRKPKLPWKQMEVPSFTATETSVCFYSLPSVSMEVYLLPSTPMEAQRLSTSVEASRYFHLLPSNSSQAPTNVHGGRSTSTVFGSRSASMEVAPASMERANSFQKLPPTKTNARLRGSQWESIKLDLDARGSRATTGWKTVEATQSRWK